MTSRVYKPVRQVQPGQRLTASLWNDLAGSVNELAAARDLEAPITAAEAAALPSSVGRWELSRNVEVVRITNPDDETQFVDVERPLTITWRDASSGQVLTDVFAS